jgi:Methyltransferase domain
MLTPTERNTNDISLQNSPFEWLTSSESILPIVESLLLRQTTTHDANDNNNHTSWNHNNRTALHIGCGTSTLGELLLSELQFSYVLNIDREETALEYMRQRSRERGIVSSSNLEYRYFDFETYDQQQQEEMTSQFQFILDKGTLDGVLCESLNATVGLLSLVYNALQKDGWYIIISFHNSDFIIQLLQDLPGAEWNVMEWNKDENTTTIRCNDEKTNPLPSNSNMVPSLLQHLYPISRQDLSIVCCQKQEQQQSNLNVSSLSCFHQDDIRNHIIHVMDQWFQTNQPERRKELEIAFDTNKEDEEKSLYECYMLFFTDEERQDLSYEYFLEDWDAYLQLEEVDSTALSTTSMTLTTAIHFLQQMQ